LLNGDEGVMETWFKRRTKGPIVWKWLHYFDIYERHFHVFRNASRINLLEFGVNAGGSIDLWRAYFGPGLHYYGVDINPACKKFEASDAKIILGDQSSLASLTQIRDTLPEMDIIIDDGGHSDLMQTNTFQIMHQKLRPSGVYLCEDLGTSFHLKQMQDNNGYSMLDLTKDLIDKTQALIPLGTLTHVQGYIWESNSLPFIMGSSVRKWPVDDYTRTSDNVHVYRSIVVVEKSAHTLSAKSTSSQQSNHHNMDKYKVHLQKFQNAPIVNLVSHGGLDSGTISMYRNFLGPGLRHCSVESSIRFDTVIFSMESSPCTSEIGEKTSDVHIVIDGPGHSDRLRVDFFKDMFWRLHPQGVYIADGIADSLQNIDLHDNKGYSMLSLAKDLVDKSQAWLFPSHLLRRTSGYVWNLKDTNVAYPGTSVRVWPIDDFVRTANNIHVYQGSFVIEKCPRSSEAPKSRKAGTENNECQSTGGCINSSSKP